MVAIVDPHISRDPNYFVHVEATKQGYYVKDCEGKDFIGDCWPKNESSWIDFFNPNARKFWADLYSFDKYTVKFISFF